MKLLIDKNVNFKELRKFIQENNICCELFGLNAEQQNRKIEEKPGLLILGGPTKLPARLASKGTIDNFEKIKRIIGGNNLGDCLHLESVTFENYDFLITEDNDILSKKKEIKEQFPNLELSNLFDFKISQIKK